MMENNAVQPVDLPESKRQRSLRASVWDASFYSAMVGFAETYYIPLLIFIGATNAQVGIYTAAPQFGIAFAQFISIWLVERYRARKRIIIAASTVQSAALATVAVMTLTGSIRPWTFIAVTMLYFAINGLSLPAWNSLIGDLTTPETRGNYFGRRNGLSQLVTFCAILAGGLTLQQFDNAGAARTGFAVILFAALASRFGSIFSLSRHFDVPYTKHPEAYFSFWQFVRRGPRSNFAHFVFFLALMSLCVQIASPFFAVYMIRDLEFSYIQYTIAQGVFTACQFLAMRRWGPFADRYGNRLVLRITATMVPIVPLLWFLSGNFYYIVLIQTIAGLSWAGWSLASANFLFDAVTPPKRARAAAYLNFFNSAGICCGSLLGAFIATRAPAALDTGVMQVSFLSSLEYIFLISAGLRFVVVFLFMPTVREVRKVTQPDPRDMFVMLTHVRPFSGFKHEPFTGAPHKQKNGRENHDH